MPLSPYPRQDAVVGREGRLSQAWDEWHNRALSVIRALEATTQAQADLITAQAARIAALEARVTDLEGA